MAVGANATAADLSARPRSLGNGRITRAERAELQALTTSLGKGRHFKRRPKTWGDCQARVPGPCPWVSCRHHLFLEVDSATGAVKANFPGKQIDEIGETCSLKVAARGAHTLERTGELLNLTLERARQVEADALASSRRKLAAEEKYPPALRAEMARLLAAMEARTDAGR